jgi:hypothetical protein
VNAKENERKRRRVEQAQNDVRQKQKMITMAKSVIVKTIVMMKSAAAMTPTLNMSVAVIRRVLMLVMVIITIAAHDP